MPIFSNKENQLTYQKQQLVGFHILQKFGTALQLLA